MNPSTNNSKCNQKLINNTIHSQYYCPNCGKSDDEGDLMIKETQRYVDRKSYNYYCTRCTVTFKIKEISK